MHDQPRLEPQENSDFYADRRVPRRPVPGTVARGELKRDDDPFYTGRLSGKFIDHLPMEPDRALLNRGQERYNIYCTPCHDYVGEGRGMVVRRGFSPPPSFHSPRMLALPLGHYFDVMTNGFGIMYSYAATVKPRDRWAIAAYIRALQLSQNAKLSDAPDDVQERLMRRRDD